MKLHSRNFQRSQCRRFPKRCKVCAAYVWNTISIIAVECFSFNGRKKKSELRRRRALKISMLCQIWLFSILSHLTDSITASLHPRQNLNANFVFQALRLISYFGSTHSESLGTYRFSPEVIRCETTAILTSMVCSSFIYQCFTSYAVELLDKVVLARLRYTWLECTQTRNHCSRGHPSKVYYECYMVDVSQNSPQPLIA